MSRARRVPARDQVKSADTWDLASLFTSDQKWERAFRAWEKKKSQYASFQGTLGQGGKQLVACLQFDSELDREGERLGVYAFLKTAEDQGNSEYQRMMGRFHHAASEAAQAASFIRPEILAIPDDTYQALVEDPLLERFQLQLERLRRFKPHTLTDREEQLMAMQSEVAHAPGQVFRQLLDTDMKFGQAEDGSGKQVELTNANFIEFLNSPKRTVRRKAFERYYAQFEAHQHTLAATLQGSVQKDVFHAKARGYPSALEAALFPDNVPVAVYNNLIRSVRRNLPALHQYYAVRKRAMKLRELHHYDTYVPILKDIKKRHTWNQASDLVVASLVPLGHEYVTVLEQGLRGRWCDRYPNRGKQSGAFSCGTFDGDPYILMNYSQDVLGDVFTLAHEAGHSMHSYFSAGHQPYEYYDYTIFVAEVASTFNEQLLTRKLLDQATSDRERAYLINREIDDMRGTIIRQTMFAEFEKVIHEAIESGEPLTIQLLRAEYRKLLDVYFGPEFVVDEVLELECLRIPHFYNAFYVYKYATGLSAAIALSNRVLRGGDRELNDYLNFLRGGCSLDPLDLLRSAGVDMSKPKPVNDALRHFASRVEELDQLL